MTPAAAHLALLTTAMVMLLVKKPLPAIAAGILVVAKALSLPAR